MALIKCIECGKEFSDKASACPNCACPIEVIKKDKTKKENIKKEDPKKDDVSIGSIGNMVGDLVKNKMTSVKDSINNKKENVKEKIDKKINKERNIEIENNSEEQDKDNINNDNSNITSTNIKNNNINPFVWVAIFLPIILLIFILILAKPVNTEKGKPNDYEETNNSEVIQNKYKVKIHIDFTENLVFSKYDVKVTCDEESELLEHGEDKDFVFELDKGEKEIIFAKSSDSDINEKVKINVTSDMEIGYKISCHYDSIDVNLLYENKDEKVQNNQVKIDFNSSKFDGMKYQEVVQILKELGFTNIEEKPVYDIVYDITPEGEIDTVTIDGNDNYVSGNVFNNDVKVVVSYHMKDDDDPRRIKAPYDGDTAKQLTYKEVEQAFKDAGFTNVTLKEEKTSDSSKDGKVSTIIIGYLHADLSVSYDPDEKVEINYYLYVEKKQSGDSYGDNKHYTLAKQNFESKGESLYPYGIKYHWWVGLRDFTYMGNGVWHIEVEVTITNKYNAKRDAVASGDVDFIAEEVKNFKVVYE